MIREEFNLHIRRRLLAVVSAVALFAFSSFSRAETGVTDSQIVVGQSVALTGVVSNNHTVQEGLTLYLDKLNKEGGVHGRRIRLITYDDGYDPKRSVENLSKLIQTDGVFAILQNFGAAASKAAIPLIERTDVPFLTPIGSADEIRTPTRRNYFFVRAGANAEMEELVRYLVETLNLRRIGGVYQNDASGQGINRAAIASLGRHGISPAFVHSLPRGSHDVAEIVKKMKETEVQAVILAIQGDAAAAIIHQAASVSLRPVYAANASLGTQEFADRVKADAPTLYVTLGYPAINKNSRLRLVQSYLKDAELAGQKPTSSAFEGYLNAAVFAEALRRAGKDLTRDSLRNTLERMHEVDIGGIRISYSPENHRGLSRASVTVLNQGSFDPVDSHPPDRGPRQTPI